MSSLSKVLRALVVVAFVASAPAIARAQGNPSQHDHAAVQPQMKMQQMKMQQMKGEMRMPSMDEMAARKKANTERIAALMAKLKDARGDDDRTAAMAEVLGILVEERAAMQQHCAEMHAMMTK